MRNVLYRVSQRAASVTFLAMVMLALCQSPARALDLFASHEVTVQFVTQDGQPMADAEVRVFAPGAPARPALTGRTDRDGKFKFAADRDGFWTAEARNGTEVARATVRVGNPGAADDEPLSPYLLIGLLGVLLVIAVWYRFLRTRTRARRR
jgi:hypothetical protein